MASLEKKPAVTGLLGLFVHEVLARMNILRNLHEWSVPVTTHCYQAEADFAAAVEEVEGVVAVHFAARGPTQRHCQGAAHAVKICDTSTT